MLQLNALKIDINTTDGLYGVTIPFKSGLNVIRANNTSGKSTIFQSILYALGFEELIGGKNEKTMQSVLKDEVISANKSYRVLQSEISIEITNGQNIITVKRSVINEKRNSKLVDVIKGPAITQPNETYEMLQMFLHDKGSASDEIYGFHLFLESFLGWKLPEVLQQTGEEVKLYLPLVAPSFIVEQKAGWANFFATIPFYGIKNAQERVIEFVLDLDVYKNEKDKLTTGIEKRILTEKWGLLYSEFKRLGERLNAEIVGITESPEIINNFSEVYFRVLKGEKYYLIPELIKELQAEFTEINTIKTAVGDNINRNQDRLNGLQIQLSRYSLKYEQLTDTLLHEKEKLRQYILQRKNVEEDLVKNKSAQKMYNLGAEVSSPIAEDKCPTCKQDINPSLLPPETKQVPMLIQENIDFLDAQRKMIDVFIKGQRKKIIEGETLLNDYKNQLSSFRFQIRLIKRDLTEDERLPSEELIERKVNLKRLLSLYKNLLEQLDEYKEKLYALNKQWQQLLTTEKNLPRDFFTVTDREKLKDLETYFLALLKRFNYNSKDKDTIKISPEKYLPVIEVQIPNERSRFYDIRFDSSGSDHIRCMWAYYISLMATSNKHQANHPKFLMFDEPQQQSASTRDFHECLKLLSNATYSQSIVFASFQNSIPDFKQATKDLAFNLIQTEGKFINKLSQT